MSKHSYTNAGPTRSYENASNSNIDMTDGLQNQGTANTYDSLEHQQDHMHIYEVANVTAPTEYETALTTPDSSSSPVSGSRYIKVRANNGDVVAVPRRSEVKLPRRTIVVLVVGTLLLSTFISLICGVIVYHVTSSNVKDADERYLPSGSSGTANVSDGMRGELYGLRDTLYTLAETMEEYAALLTHNISEVGDVLESMKHRLEELEMALYHHNVNRSSTGTPPTVNNCQSDWKFYGDKCYFVGTAMELTYQNAEDFCESEQSHMVSINSRGENKFVKDLLKRMDVTRSYWLGMTDLKTEGTWLWNRALPVVFTDWYRGNEPNGGDAANCATFWTYVEYQWTDNPCLEEYYPICEKYSSKV